MGAFRDFFTGLWNDYIKSPLEDVKGYLDTKVGAPIKDAIGNVFDVLGLIKTEVGEIPTKISETTTKLGGVKDDLDGMYAWFVEQKEGVVGFFENVIEYRRNWDISFWIGWMQRVKCVTALKNVNKWMPKHVRENEGVKGYYKLRTEELTEEGSVGLKDVAGSMFRPLAGELYKGFGGLKDEMEGVIEDVLKSAVVPGASGITDTVKESMGLLLDGVLDTLDPKGDKIPAEMRKDYEDKMGNLLGLGLTFTVGTALAELIHPTKELGLGHISHFLYDTLGFRALMDAYIDPIRLNLVKMPVKYNINQLTTPFSPGMKEGMEWYGRGHIDEDEFTVLRAKAGIEPQWDYRFQRMGTKPSSYFMLNAIAREGFWDVDDFKFWLSDAGYGAFQITKELLSPYEVKYGLKPPRTTQIDFLLDAYKQMNLRSTVGDVRGIRRTLMAEGWITRKDFEDDLGKYKITAADAKDVLDAIELKQEIKEKKELANAYEKKYLNNRITKDELTAKLIELGRREGWVKARVEKLFTQKEGKLAVEGEEKTLPDGKIINAYKWGQKEKGWAVKMLDDKGWSTEDAVLLAESVDIKIENDTIKEWMRAYEKRTENGRMGIEELKAMYVKLGKTGDWAEARGEYMTEKILGEEEVPVPLIVIEQGIKISSKPSSARITIDGVETIKLTPETIDLSAGSHTIKLEVAGYDPLEDTFMIPAGEYLEVKYELTKIVMPVVKQGIKVSSKPSSARITIDGFETVKLTPETIDLDAGSHTIKLEVAGYEPLEDTVMIPAGKYLEKKYVLTKIEEA